MAGDLKRPFLLLALICLSFAVAAEASEFIVGDEEGWNYQMETWPATKRFIAGDVLVFTYNRDIHNVVVVNPKGYDNSCVVPPGSKVLRTGNDRVTLVEGVNYFMCSNTKDCEAGMKMEVHAAKKK